ncbi:MAG: cytochrome c biogenesis protein ResB [Thermoguttaceae bacterium]
MANRAAQEEGATVPSSLFVVLFRWLVVFFRWLASLQVAVVLIVLLAIVLIVATFVESWLTREISPDYGREYTQWRVYHSQWFMAILLVVGVNVLAATLRRFPWGWRRVGFLVTHAGILVLLAGAMQTFRSGIDGQIALVEGETADRIMVTDREELVVAWEGQKGFHGEGPVHYLFRAGPVDWPEGKSLDFGRLGGMGLKVLKFYRHARVDEHWVADEEGQGGPALEFGLAGKDGQTVHREWLAPDEIGDEQSVGPAQFRLLRATADSMADDFLHPPAADMDKEGVLSVHYEGRMYRVPVSANLGKKVPIGETKAFVEIVGYFPNGTPVGSGNFVSQGNEPRNPVVTLRVYLPGKSEPVRQVAFAAKPLLSFEGVHGWSCPVKFWYHHPKVAVASGVEFLQTPNRKLYCRVARDGKYQPGAAVATGDEVEMGGQFKVSVLQYLPKARREVTCEPVEPAAGMARAAGPAAMVQVTAGETTRQLWLKENDANYGLQSFSTPEGRLEIRFANEEIPLGFVLKLKEFHRGRNPGGMGDASFVSTVQLLDRNGRRLGEDRQISMNEPLTRGKYTLYQSSFSQTSSGKNISVFSVAYDPGQLLEYTGWIMVCAGSVLMFLTRALKRSPRADRSAGEAAAGNGNGRTSRPREGKQVARVANS